MSKRVASLSGAALRVEALREEGRAELVDLLESLPGSKCLVLESHIGGLLNHVIPEGSKVSFRALPSVSLFFVVVVVFAVVGVGVGNGCRCVSSAACCLRFAVGSNRQVDTASVGCTLC